MLNFPYLDETEELTDTVRANVGGSFVRLSDGFCHYELTKSENAPTIVLIHGFSVPYYIFDPTFEFLAGTGFQVVGVANGIYASAAYGSMMLLGCWGV